MNIYMTGASGTGKTTTANMLSEHYNLPVYPSITRNSPWPMGSVDHQVYIRNIMYNLTQTQDNTIFDRCPIDIIGYDVGYKMKREFQRSMSLADAWIREKPIILYFPYFWEPEDDGFRPTDETLARCVDGVISNYLWSREVEFLYMPNMSPRERLDLAVDYIDSKGY